MRGRVALRDRAPAWIRPSQPLHLPHIIGVKETAAIAAAFDEHPDILSDRRELTDGEVTGLAFSECVVHRARNARAWIIVRHEPDTPGACLLR